MPQHRRRGQSSAKATFWVFAGLLFFDGVRPVLASEAGAAYILRSAGNGEDAVPSSLSPQELFDLALRRQSEGHHAETLQLLERIRVAGIELAPTLSYILNLEGISNKALGQVGAARASYEAALTAAPYNHHARFNLGSLYLYEIAGSYSGDGGGDGDSTITDAYGAAEAAVRCLWGALPPPERTALVNAADGGERQQNGSSVCPPLPPSEFPKARTGCDIAWETVVATASDVAAGAAFSDSTALETASAAAAAAEGGGSAESVGGPINAAMVLNELGVAYSALGRGEAAAAALRRATAKDALQAGAWANLASAFTQIGLPGAAVDAAANAVRLAPTDGRILYALGSAQEAAGLLDAAEASWRRAAAAVPAVPQALTSLGHVEGHRGDLAAARGWYAKALRAAEEANNQPATDAALLLLATAVLPQIYRSPEHVLQVRRSYNDNLSALLRRQRPLDVRSPETTAGSGALGYYAIYQGYQDRDLRQKLARVYWNSAPSLRFTAPFLLAGGGGGGTLDAPDGAVASPGGCAAAGAAAAGGGTITGDGSVAPSEAVVEATGGLMVGGGDAIRLLTHTASGMGGGGLLPLTASSQAGALLPRPPRLRVGFLSAFFFWHSVGLLTEGVVTGLDRRRFDVTAIFLQPQPRDDVYWRIWNGVETAIDVPSMSLAACRRTIAALELDVLVFTEVGMDTTTYMLAFSRLARRSALFWGHAVTSGISAADAVARPLPAISATAAAGMAPAVTIGSGGGSSSSGSGSGGGSDGENTTAAAAAAAAEAAAGGIDYFVSSMLFEPADPTEAQRRYAERLYLMRGLTTKFRPPIAPAPAATRASLGVPVAACTAALYLVPQTLYKMHPDFDRLLAGVLRRDPSGCVVMPQAQEGAWTDQLRARMQLSLSAVLDRVVMVPRMNFAEFVALAALADVVLDPFPVGGGRSSFEVFSTGTPIIALHSRTSVLQLTAGMYQVMGMVGSGQGATDVAVGTAAAIGTAADAAITNAAATAVDATAAADVAAATGAHAGGVQLVVHSEEDFVESAVAVATDAALQARLRRKTLDRNHRLYNQESVVSEWEEFLQYAACSPRPSTARNETLPALLGPALSPGGADPAGAAAAAAGPTMAALATAESAAAAASGTPLLLEAGGAIKASGGRLDLPSTRLEFSTGGGANSAAEAGPEESANVRLNDAAAPAAAAAMAAAGMTELAAKRSACWQHEPVWGWRRIDSLKDSCHGGDIGYDGAPDPKDPEVLYAAQFDLPDPRNTAPPRLFVAEVRRGQDASGVAAAVAAAFGMDALQAAWIDALLRRGVERLERPVVWAQQLSVLERLPAGGNTGSVTSGGGGGGGGGSGTGTDQRQRPPPSSPSLDNTVAVESVQVGSGPEPFVVRGPFLVEVHEGDDLAQVAAWHDYREGLGGREAAAAVERHLAAELPQHATAGWIAARAIRPRSATAAAAKDGAGAAAGGTVAAMAGRKGESDGRNGGGGGGDDDGSRNGGGNGDVAWDGVGSNDDDGDDCITVGVTTCRRLPLLRQTLRSLQAALGPLPGRLPGGACVCDVVVVDDGSTAADRAAMLAEFDPEGRWQWMFKGSGRRGHADSLNLLLSAVRSRYLFYLEDDWLTLPPSPPQSQPPPPPQQQLSPQSVSRQLQLAGTRAARQAPVLSFTTGRATATAAEGGAAAAAAAAEANAASNNIDAGGSGDDDNNLAFGADFVSAALAVLQESPEEMAQVLINDQSSRDCAEARPGACPAGEVGQGAGWSRMTPETNVTYRLHEFGVMYASHAFSYWPGFSLNPALWDLRRLGLDFGLRSVAAAAEAGTAAAEVATTAQQHSAGRGRPRDQRHNGGSGGSGIGNSAPTLPLVFDTADLRFEQSMSLRLQRAGLAFGHLVGARMRHIGMEASAYALNGFTRPWDAPSAL